MLITLFLKILTPISLSLNASFYSNFWGVVWPRRCLTTDQNFRRRKEQDSRRGSQGGSQGGSQEKGKSRQPGWEKWLDLSRVRCSAYEYMGVLPLELRWSAQVRDILHHLNLFLVYCYVHFIIINI